MKTVCIQVGHWGIEGITQTGLRSWRSADSLKRSTGASGERDYHWNKVMPLLKDKLIKAGVQVYIVDAIYRPETYNRDYDLWISLHFDGGGEENRSMCSEPANAEVNPQYLTNTALQKAINFCNIWRTEFPKMTGTVNRNERITAGMKHYYAFDYVGVNTPSVIVEHFNHTSPKGIELKGKPELIAEADFQCILKFLGISETIPCDCEALKKELNKVKEELGRVKEESKNKTLQIEQLTYEINQRGIKIGQLEGKITNAKNYIASL